MIKSKQDAMKDVGKVQRHRIEIQKRTLSKDNIGNQIETWELWRNFWVEANGLWGVEYYAAAAQNQENTIEFTLRYCVDLESINTLDYRVIYKGKVYDIKKTDNVKHENVWFNINILERGINGS